MIPCKEIKCLKYPVCKSKRTIECNDLLVHYYDLIVKHSKERVFQILTEDLPKLCQVITTVHSKGSI